MSIDGGDDDALATLAAWRERGDARLDPVRFRMIESMAQRAASHQGPARQVLDDRLAALMTAFAQDVSRAAQVQAAKPQAPASTGGPLARLLDYIRQHAPSHAKPEPAAASEALSTTPGELEALRYLRSTWSRLSADKRLTQSLAKVPDKAGPLNSHHLVHRALASMRETSPEYFHRFVSYVDGLLALDQMSQATTAGPPATPSEAPPAPRQRGKARANR